LTKKQWKRASPELPINGKLGSSTLGRLVGTLGWASFELLEHKQLGGCNELKLKTDSTKPSCVFSSFSGGTSSTEVAAA